MRWNVFEEEQKDKDGKKGIHRETEAKLHNAKHTQRKSLVLALCSAETDITHSRLIKLHIYTFLAFRLLPSLASIMISLYISEGICLPLTLSAYSLCSNKPGILLQGWGAGSVRCFLRGDICSEDNNGYIVLTAWLVSLLVDSSAFLKTLPLWLGALFLSQWSSNKKPLGSVGALFPKFHSLT